MTNNSLINLMSFKNKRILVTGASSGIGQALSISLSELGADVILVARNKNKLEKTLSMMSNGNHIIVPFDLTQFDLYKNFFNNIIKNGNKLNGLVHCAGIAKPIPINSFTNKLIQETMNINYYSFLELVKYYSKKTVSCGGSIVGVSSINTHKPEKCMTVYAGSKAALEASVKTMSIELIKKNIRINTVVPGAVDTEMSRKFIEQKEDLNSNYRANNQLMGISKPIDIANIIVFLLSDASKFVTGRHYYIDGGRF